MADKGIYKSTHLCDLIPHYYRDSRRTVYFAEVFASG